MKLSHLAIVLGALFVVYLAYDTIDTHTYTHTYEEGITAESNLSAALQDGLTSVAHGDDNLFDDENDRQKVLQKVESSLCKSFGYDDTLQADKIMEYVPALVLVDWDGYYVWENSTYKDADGYEIGEWLEDGKHQWSETYDGRYIVKYSLLNTVTVTDTKSKISYTGSYAQAYSKMGSPEALKFMTSTKKFGDERNHVVIYSINQELNNLINTNDSVTNIQHRTYDITLPETDTNEARRISKPCVIGFWQDIQMSTTEDMLTVYAFSASEVTDADLYYVEDNEGDAYYYKVNSSDLTKYEFVGTMEECAKRKANPGF